jgi:hypothetical protein
MVDQSLPVVLFPIYLEGLSCSKFTSGVNKNEESFMELCVLKNV